ncbi:MAG: ferritin family protein [candidate division Zixibacteria bacterium]|nr:ferritin family protein [candidate division Zixibacteria bacterium]
MTESALGLADGLLKAMKAERDGNSFYLMAANSTSDPKGRQIFEVLAREELDHLQFLKEHYDSWVMTGKLSLTAKLHGRLDLAGPSPLFSDSFHMRIKEAHFEMSALSIGIQLELDAMAFYRTQSELTAEPEAKAFFAELASWEQGHYQALLRQQEELKDDYWLEAGFSPF